MNNLTIRTEVQNLIELCIEGEYWDFKEQWHSNNADLLHDIICMANNLKNRDAYIIIGVANDGSITGVSTNNRKNQQNVIDFLKDKKFAGGIRPSLYVKTLDFDDGKEIDVIMIENSIHTPYFLIEDVKDGDKMVLKNSIYTRVGDTNTPKTSTADIDKIEYLWRKRFGLDLSPLQKVTFLLRDPKSWLPIGTDGQHSNIQYHGQYYHKMFPEFILNYEMCEERFSNGRIDSIEHDIYWMNRLPSPLHNAFIYTLNVKYHSTVMYSTLAVFADDDRFNRVLWKRKILCQNADNENISYCFIEKDSMDFMLDNWLCNSHETITQIEENDVVCALEPWVLQPEYLEKNPYSVVPVFENAKEHIEFIDYVIANKVRFLEETGDYSFLTSQYRNTHAQCKDPDYIEYLCKCGETLVSWLDNWRAGDF